MRALPVITRSSSRNARLASAGQAHLDAVPAAERPDRLDQVAQPRRRVRDRLAVGGDAEQDREQVLVERLLLEAVELERAHARLEAAGDPHAVVLREVAAADPLHRDGQPHALARPHAPRRLHAAQEREALAAAHVDVRADARDVRRAALVPLDQADRGGRVDRRAERDRVADRAEVGAEDRRRQVAVAEPRRRLGTLAEGDPQAHAPGQPARGAAHHAAGRLRDRQRRDGAERGEAGRVVDVGLVGDRGLDIAGRARVVIHGGRQHRRWSAGARRRARRSPRTRRWSASRRRGRRPRACTSRP